MTTHEINYLNAKELSEILKVPKNTVYYWVHKGIIPHVSFGKHKRFILADVIKHFEDETKVKIEKNNSLHEWGDYVD